MRRVIARGQPHRLGDPGREAVGDGERRLGGDVVGSEAGASRRQHEVAEPGVGEVLDPVLDQRPVVGDELAGHDLGAQRLGRPALELGAADVLLPAPLRPRAADAEHDRAGRRAAHAGAFHSPLLPPLLWSRRTRSISTPRSIALTMS